MQVGFTGTRDGVTGPQLQALRDWFRVWLAVVPRAEAAFHHGACIGADEQAVALLSAFRVGRVVAHPATFLTSPDALRRSTVVLGAKPPLDRNRDIVDATFVLLACPKGPEERRSGTWATVRYARRTGKKVVLLWPDGSVADDNPG